MSNITWSHSRIETIKSCKLKYELTYKKGLYVDEDIKSISLRKGSAFHEFTEAYNGTQSKEEINSIIETLHTKYGASNENDTFDITDGVNKYIEFFDSHIKQFINDSKEFVHEKKLDFYIWEKDIKSTGSIDLLIITNDDRAFIWDWKTGKTAKVGDYENQMKLYMYAINQIYNIPFNKIECKLFFPFAEETKKGIDSIIKKVDVTEEEIMINSALYKEEVKQSFNLTKFPATPNSKCTWCAFAGSRYCTLTQKMKVDRPRGIIIKQKQWAVDLSL